MPTSTRGLRRIKITRRAFNARKLQGLRIITRELIRRRVPLALKRPRRRAARRLVSSTE